ncbi:MAG TPA: hypothetical protein VN726_10485 [Hanamia sp.]|nr:hypothetical protein [Hanamia sp.]
MKKFLITALMIAGSYGMANAQAQPKVATQKTTAHTSTHAVTAKSTPAPVVKMNSTKTTTVTTPHMKADGTADKRFKENKTTTTTKTTAVGPVKKDGTPDMRYKANKKH